MMAVPIELGEEVKAFWFRKSYDMLWQGALVEEGSAMYKSAVKLSASGDQLFSEGDVIPGTFFEVDMRARVSNAAATNNTLCKLQVWVARGDPLAMVKIKEWAIKRSDFVESGKYKAMCMRSISLNLTDRNFQVRVADYANTESELYIDWIAGMPMVRQDLGEFAVLSGIQMGPSVGTTSPWWDDVNTQMMACGFFLGGVYMQNPPNEYGEGAQMPPPIQTCSECGVSAPYGQTLPHKPGCSYRYSTCPNRTEAWRLMNMDLMRDPRLSHRLSYLDRYGALETFKDRWVELGIETEEQQGE
ncbi:MAG: hypothetical protein PHV74_00150 [Dehalococcoidia bacterium]|nr:hypothetical protein [Dehalococcoidia bacterium]